MAKGPPRAPSHNAYKGAAGQTKTASVHVTGPRGDLVTTTVYTSLDALADPELAERLFAERLNVARVDGGELSVAVPVVYHDAGAEVFVLVLAEADRHRELDERIRLLERLRADAAPVPLYVKEHGVVFGADGLRRYLEQKAERALAEQGSARDQDRKRAELVTREAELTRAQQKIAQQHAELERSKADLERSKADLERSTAELERSKDELDRMRAESRARVIAAAQIADTTTISPAPTRPPAEPEGLTNPITRADLEDVEELDEVDASTDLAARAFDDSSPSIRTPPAATDESGDREESPRRPLALRIPTAAFEDGERTGDDMSGLIAMDTAGFARAVVLDDRMRGQKAPPGSDPLTTQLRELSVEGAVDAARATATKISLRDGAVRLTLVAGEHIVDGLRGEIDIRVLLHRLGMYPVITVVVGPPLALRAPHPTDLVVIPLDIASDSDRAVLTGLSKKFEVTVDIVSRGAVVRRVRLTAPLAENIAYIMRAADDHLRGIEADGETEASFERARDTVLGAGYDLFGLEHIETAEFRDDKLGALQTATHVRRALAVARRFARPSREDYLVCVRGYPLSRWRELRRAINERALSWGLWMGPDLAQIAVSDGLARSRRDLVVKLDAGFEDLRCNADANDLDAEATEDNRKAIDAEARELGVELRARAGSGAIKSEDAAAVAGSIERPSTQALPVQRTTEELLKLLDDKTQRVSAATELCERGDPRAAGPVIQAVNKLSRSEAVRVLGRSVKFGPAAAAPLMQGLHSSKAYLRHGCALALALLRTEEGTLAVVEALLGEPTEIWREIARALGQVGPQALMPLASQVGRLGEDMTPALRERVAWAMAHIGVRGGKAALEQMANGHSLMAPIAKQALGLHENAVRDEVRVRPGPLAGKDVTVNRAFSRKFFEALETDRPEMAQAGLHDLEESRPMELLDESDLIIEDPLDGDEDAAELDESDLIQT